MASSVQLFATRYSQSGLANPLVQQPAVIIAQLDGQILVLRPEGGDVEVMDVAVSEDRVRQQIAVEIQEALGRVVLDRLQVVSEIVIDHKTRVTRRPQRRDRLDGLRDAVLADVGLVFERENRAA